MKKLESKTQTVNASAEEVYNFLNDFNNLEELMPEKVSNWSSTKDTCKFTIQGMATLNMKQGKNEEHTLVQMVATGNNPFYYDLNNYIKATGDKSCDVNIILNADMNPMLAMMAKGPLENFINILVKELAKIYE